ncbi:uncharacterized protein [Nicotiana tomentosiformis]|uniref:uncharacterized protein n=1 Tax=Nicotiana tomentosiformis TaxID=4098 RepID=UPI00388C5E48
MKSLSINVPLVKALEQMPGYAKFMKDLVTKKRSMNFETIKVGHQVGAIVYSMAPKFEDPVFKTLGIGQPRPTSMRLQMADPTMKRPLGVNEDIFVHVDKFIFSADFVILYCEVDYEVLIILRIPFLATGKAFCDVEAGEFNFLVGDEKVVFYVCKSIRQPNSNEVCSFVDLVTDIIVDETSATINVGDILEAILLNFDDDEMDGFMKCVNSLQGMGSYNYAPRKMSLDLENKTTPHTKPSIEEPPTLELKPLPPHFRYEFLGPCSTLPFILSSCLTNVQVDSTLEMLQKRKKAIGWTLAYIQGIIPALCKHKIKLEDGAKSYIEH